MGSELLIVIAVAWVFGNLALGAMVYVRTRPCTRRSVSVAASTRAAEASRPELMRPLR